MPKLHEQALHTKLAEEAFRNFKADFDIDIRTASQENIRRLQKSLDPLSPAEEIIIGLLRGNLVAQHKTTDLTAVQQAGKLLSIRERQRLGGNAGNRHTSRTGGDDLVFFTVGLPGHKPAAFLEQEGGDIIEFKFSGMLADFPEIMQFFFTGNHLSDYQTERVSAPIEMGGTTFRSAYTEHADGARTRTDYYTYQTGNKHTRIVPMADEIFCGEDVPLGLALQLVTKLRLIGGQYQDHIHTVVTSTISTEKKLNILSAGMAYLMPADQCCEGKLPIGISVDPKYNKHINISASSRTSSGHRQCFEEYMKKQKAWNAPDNQEAIKNALKISDLDTLEKIITRIEPNASSLSILFKHSIIGRDLGSNRIGVAKLILQFLIKLNEINLDELLKFAAEAQDLEILGLFLSAEVGVPNPTDDMIRVRANPNAYIHREPLLVKICDGNKHASLTALIPHTIISYRFGYNLLCRSASSTCSDFDALGCFNILLLHKTSLTPLEPYGDTPLKLLAQLGKERDLELALRYGADVNHPFYLYRHSMLLGKSFTASHQNGYTALHFLVMSRNVNLTQEKRIRMATILLDHGANINARAQNGDTPYSLAIEHGHTDLARLFTTRGANTNTTKTPYETCTDHTEIVIVVVRGFNEKGEPSIILGKKTRSDGSIIQEYCFPGGFLDLEDRNDPVKAALRELKEETRIDLRPQIEKGSIKPEILHRYETIGHSNTHQTITIVLFDLEHSLATQTPTARDDFYEPRQVPLSLIRADRGDTTPLKERFNTCLSDDPDTPIRPSNGVIIEILEHGPHPEKIQQLDTLFDTELNGHHSLLLATKEGDYDRVKDLIARGVAYHHDEYEQPLHTAAALGRLAIVKLLIDQGHIANRISFDKVGSKNTFMGVLDAAARSGNVELFNYLLPITLKPTDERSTSCSYSTIFSSKRILHETLITATQLGSIPMVQRLLDTHIVGVNETSPDHQYPLYHAVKHDQPKMVEFLLGRGANTHGVYPPDTTSLRIASLIAQARTREHIASTLGVSALSIDTDVYFDERGKTSIHILFKTHDLAIQLAQQFTPPAEVREAAEKKQYYVRLGEIRIDALIGEEGKHLYRMIKAYHILQPTTTLSTSHASKLTETAIAV